MWGGRFDKAPADRARAFTRSFPIDRRMYREDIVASRAHAAMLGRSGLLPKDSVLAIIGGLFVLETVSVIVQVISFKLTGKRVFMMAPLHHHFEKKG